MIFFRNLGLRISSKLRTLQTSTFHELENFDYTLSLYAEIFSGSPDLQRFDEISSYKIPIESMSLSVISLSKMLFRIINCIL